MRDDSPIFTSLDFVSEILLRGAGLLKSAPSAASCAGFIAASSRAAFHERCKIDDIIMQGIDAALRKRGYPHDPQGIRWGLPPLLVPEPSA